MTVFAVTYHYGATPEELDAVRPTHRAWLSEQLAAENLMASGPMVGVPTALLIWRSNSLEELNDLLNLDPFDQAGFIAERTITEWNPVFGPWS